MSVEKLISLDNVFKRYVGDTKQSLNSCISICIPWKKKCSIFENIAFLSLSYLRIKFPSSTSNLLIFLQPLISSLNPQARSIHFGLPTVHKSHLAPMLNQYY